MKGNYTGSLHDLMTRQPKFMLPGCTGVYKIERINEFGDCVLLHETLKDQWENCATIEIKRRGELLLRRRINGISFEKRIKLNSLTEVK